MKVPQQDQSAGLKGWGLFTKNKKLNEGHRKEVAASEVSRQLNFRIFGTELVVKIHGDQTCGAKTPFKCWDPLNLFWYKNSKFLKIDTKTTNFKIGFIKFFEVFVLLFIFWGFCVTFVLVGFL